MSGKAGDFELALHGLPAVECLQDLADATHLSVGLLRRLSLFASRHYRVITVAKKSGGTRTISQPSREMKAVQGWILRSILDKLSVSRASKGFEIGASIRGNALPHQGCTAVLCLDIDDFFSSVKAGWVNAIFRAAGYGPRAAGIFTDICTLNGSLPQGAPTSPKLANLACWRMDRRLMGFVGHRGIMYTRYADDMTFSAYSYQKLLKARKIIEKIVRAEGFALNDQKARLIGPSRARKVTGLVVHDSGVGVGRRRYRELRARIHATCLLEERQVDRQEIAQLNGWLAFVKGVDGERSVMLRRYLAHLKRKYPQSGVCLVKSP